MPTDYLPFVIITGINCLLPRLFSFHAFLLLSAATLPSLLHSSTVVPSPLPIAIPSTSPAIIIVTLDTIQYTVQYCHIGASNFALPSFHLHLHTLYLSTLDTRHLTRRLLVAPYRATTIKPDGTLPCALCTPAVSPFLIKHYRSKSPSRASFALETLCSALLPTGPPAPRWGGTGVTAIATMRPMYNRSHADPYT